MGRHAATKRRRAGRRVDRANEGLAAAPASHRPRLAAWLLRPYLDLGPLVVGPLYARGIEQYWRAFAEPHGPAFALQRTLPPAFRTQLVGESGRAEFLVDDPGDLPVSLRTDRWSALCGALEQWLTLSLERRRRLVLLLHSLCLYTPVLRLLPEFDDRLLREDPIDVELAYWRASARYVLGAPSRLADYRSADMSVLEAIAAASRVAVPAAFNASVKVFVHKSKVGAPRAEIAKAGARLERALADSVGKVDRFTCALLTSRFYRAMGFLPQRLGNRAEVVRLMDLAERHARGMKPVTEAQKLVYLENLHPVLESRTKEALWLGDRELALERALGVVDLDPYDSKAWVELGEVRMARKEWAPAAEAYVVAGMLGPPASAIGRYMAGACYRKCGKDVLAAFFFKETLEVDPLGISPHDQIRELPQAAVLNALKQWSLRAF